MEGEMQRCFGTVVVCLLSTILAAKAFSQAPSIDVLAYDLQVLVDLPNHRLDVMTQLDMQRPEALASVELLFSSEAKIRSVQTVSGGGRANVLCQTTDSNTVRLALPPNASASKLSLIFEYTFPTASTIDKVFILDRGNRWYPLIVDDIALMRLTVQVAPEYDVFSAGELVDMEKTTGYSRFTWQSRIPVFKVPLVITKAGLYNEVNKECGGQELSFYFLQDAKDSNEKMADEACEAVKFFTESIGPSPHQRLTLLEVADMDGSAICSSLILVGSSFVGAFRDGYYDGLHLPIAAQWMGAGAFAKFKERGFWFLTLSLPHHLRLGYIRKSKGEEAFAKELQGLVDRYKQIVGAEGEVAILDVDFPNTKEKGLAIYAKGPVVLESVQSLLGRKVWNEFIKELYHDYLGKILTYEAFKNSLAKYDRDGKAVCKLEKMLSEKGL